MQNKEIIVGTKFTSKMQCFNNFRNLIKEETFCLLNENTQKVLLNKINGDYIYVYIVDEYVEEDGIVNIIKENVWRRIEDPFFNAEYVFLYIRENDIYTFLGLYKLKNIEEDYIEWKKQAQNKFILNKMNIKKKLKLDNETKERTDNKKVNDKELALKTLSEGKEYEIKNIKKSLRKDKDIIEAFWKAVRECDYGYYYNNLCLIISIDKYGDNIIDEFFEKEKKRHNYKIKNQYEENTEIVQFYKSEGEYKNRLEIFTKDFKPTIILIGQKENPISIEIKNKYKNNLFIEIYIIDTSRSDTKLITDDIDKIINLLRVMTYDDTTTTINTHIYYGYLNPCLEEFVKDKSIEIEIYKGTVKQIKKQIEEMPRNKFPKIYMVQTVYNKGIDEYTLNEIYETIQKRIS